MAGAADLGSLFKVLDSFSVATLPYGAAVYSVSHGISNKGDSSTYDWAGEITAAGEMLMTELGRYIRLNYCWGNVYKGGFYWGDTL